MNRIKVVKIIIPSSGKYVHHSTTLLAGYDPLVYPANSLIGVDVDSVLTREVTGTPNDEKLFFEIGY